MKTEIKEILECFSSPDINFSEMLFNRDERLLDYITNLQEENEMYAQLKDNIEKNNFGICKNILNWSAEELDEAKKIEQKSLDTINNLQEENKELLEKFSNKIEEVSNLIKENEKLKLVKDTKCASEILCECLHNDYKSRCEKAIEYIHNHQPVFELSSKEQIKEWFEKEYYVELLNILNGGDKDE